MALDVHKYGPWAVVTGASSGIGKEFAVQLARAGLSVVLVALREALLEQVRGQVKAESPNEDARVIVADLATVAGLQRVRDGTADLEVGLLVNNAGIDQTGSLWRLPAQMKQDVVALNCQASLALLLHFGNGMIRRRRGGVVNVSSRLAAATNPVCPLYSATKAFLSALSVGAADQLVRSGVDMLAAQPGKMATASLARAGVFNDRPAGAADAMAPAAVAAQSVAVLGRRALVTLGWRARAQVWLRNHLPRAASRFLLDRPVLARVAAIMSIAPYPEGRAGAGA